MTCHRTIDDHNRGFRSAQLEPELRWIPEKEEPQMENDQYLRRADGSIYGVKPAGPSEPWREAYENLDKLPYPVYDGSGARSIDLGPAVYALVDWDGKYRVGLYFNTEDNDEGGICAEFERFSDVEAFCLRLSMTQYPLNAPPPEYERERDRRPDEAPHVFQIDDDEGKDATLCAVCSRPENAHKAREISESEGPDSWAAQVGAEFFGAITQALTHLQAARTLWFEHPTEVDQLALKAYPSDLGDFDELVEQLVGWRGDMNATMKEGDR